MLISIRPKYVFVSILVLEVLLHWNIWTRDIMGIHAWRQTQTMSVVENFAFEDMNILNPRINPRGDGDGIFRMEFPLMQWVFAWFYRWFGAHLTIARVLTFIISLFSVLGFYRLLRCYELSRSTSALGAWCFAWSPLLFYYSVNPLPDNLALCFAIWSFGFLKRHQQSGSTRSVAAFAILLALASAVKLPFILFGTAYLPILFRNLQRPALKGLLVHPLIIVANLLPTAAWYIWVIPQWKNTALIGGISAETSFNYQEAIENIWGVFHSQLPELFINYGSVLFFLFGITVFFQTKGRLDKYASELLVLAAVIAFYLYEVNMIGMEHDYYLFPFVPFIFLIVTAGMHAVLSNKRVWLQYLGVLGLIILPATAYLRAFQRWTPMGNQKPLMANKEELKLLTPNDELVVVGNDASTHVYLYHLGKKGWTFEQNWLNASQLSDYIDRGAKYLYSNTDFVEQEESISQFLGEPIFQKDGITVYPLKKLSDS
ncbi:MAG: glycosyltransferase family 39 protein [Flavobacteriales bacterium]|nr:glycosyltransferase family 39 protein [Flavobacteriales bacterium]